MVQRLKPSNLKTFLLLLGMVLVVWSPFVQLEAQGHFKETYRPINEIKAAWLIGFLRFIRWQDPQITSSNDIVIGIVGTDPFDDLFDYFNDRPVMGRRLVVKKFGKYKPELDLDGCHLVYVSKSEKRRLGDVLDAVSNETLTVSEIDGFLEREGIIQFRVVNNQLTYEINQRTALDHGMVISSQLLARARRVIRHPDTLTP